MSPLGKHGLAVHWIKSGDRGILILRVTHNVSRRNFLEDRSALCLEGMKRIPLYEKQLSWRQFTDLAVKIDSEVAVQ
jgi:hypothetical protein